EGELDGGALDLDGEEVGDRVPEDRGDHHQEYGLLHGIGQDFHVGRALEELGVVDQAERVAYRERAGRPQRDPPDEDGRQHERADHPQRRRQRQGVGPGRALSERAHAASSAGTWSTPSSTRHPMSTASPSASRQRVRPDRSSLTERPSARRRSQRRTDPRYSMAWQIAASRLGWSRPGSSSSSSARTENETGVPDAGVAPLRTGTTKRPTA